MYIEFVLQRFKTIITWSEHMARLLLLSLLIRRGSLMDHREKTDMDELFLRHPRSFMHVRR